MLLHYKNVTSNKETPSRRWVRFSLRGGETSAEKANVSEGKQENNSQCLSEGLQSGFGETPPPLLQFNRITVPFF